MSSTSVYSRVVPSAAPMLVMLGRYVYFASGERPMPWLLSFSEYAASMSDIAIGFLVFALMTTTEFFGFGAA